MGRRAEQIDATRQRIVVATVDLHGTVGPAATTVAAIAERAGVTRLTVYRHFPNDEALFSACSAHWLAQQVLPAPDAWQRIQDPRRRLRTGLTDIYRFYRDGADMLIRIHRDLAELPEQQRQGIQHRDQHWQDVLLAPFSVKARKPTRARLRGVLGHAIAFSTWQSLCLDNELPQQAAVDAMTDLVLTVAERRSH
ncbi:MAG: TetR family transcriptional regulator [Streptosporangiales bacterium]|nr:TetR family transcriptional regulator [Streptosporangiales bacterium]